MAVSRLACTGPRSDAMKLGLIETTALETTPLASLLLFFG